ncbi:MAG: SGNH/GDSL hydrolase family protein [Victivallales bacterium]|nr:SGNH/GDSL hydrolase family protein [Victivallales bacterium]
MKSLLPDVKQYLFGTFSANESPVGLELCRMNGGLAEIYGRSKSAIVRAECTTNVRLRFRTDSQNVGLSLRFGDAARLIYATDIAVKGFDTISVSPLDPADGMDVNVRLPGEGMRDVTIHFPHLVKTWLKDFRIDDNASIGPAEPLGGKLMFIGDSIFQGMTASSPSRTLAAIAANLLQRDVVNVAVGGATMDAAPVECAKEYGADIALVNFGVNDYALGITLDEFRKRTSACAKALAANGAWRPVAISPVPYPNDSGKNAAGHTFAEFRKVFTDVMSSHSAITVLDGFEILPNDNDCYIDGCHPNDMGSLLYGNAIAKAIRLPS